MQYRAHLTSCCGKRVCTCAAERHRRTIAGRLVLAAVIALCLALAIAGAEIASDWLHSGGAS